MKTYVLRASHPEWGCTRESTIADLVAATIGDHGAMVHGTTGIWRGVPEPGVAITIECEQQIVERVLAALKRAGCDHVHVEKYTPTVTYE